MPDFSEELREIAREMDQLLGRAKELKITTVMEQLEEAASNVGAAASKSWIGYQAYVYYRNFKKPSNDAYFNRIYGLGPRTTYARGSRTTGDWREYTEEQVINAIMNLAENPDTGPSFDYDQEVREEISRTQKNLLSILDIESGDQPSDFLEQLKGETSGLALITVRDVYEEWIPKALTTEDKRARRQGRVAPPHLTVLARVKVIRNTLETIKALGELAIQSESHISRRRQRQQRDPFTGTRAFIGHGRPFVWRQLKDFLQERMGLETDEFNRVSAAGIPISHRLSDMMDTAGIAFLILTGEDEQADGSVRARENVVHEAGLFQGRLGFERAIVLLEEGCQEFSNITGLGQIRFPVGNITPAFEEIRKVLEREGFTG